MLFFVNNSLYAQEELSDIFNPYTMPASFYLQRAQVSNDIKRVDLQLLAAGRMLSEGKLDAAKDLLGVILPNNTMQNDIQQILLAKYFYTQNINDKVIYHLALVKNIDNIDIYYQCEYHELLAMAYSRQHQYAEAAKQRMKLDILLGEQNSQAANRKLLWQNLQKISAAELQTLYIEAPKNSTWHGWIALAKTFKAANNTAAVAQWQQQYPNHPGQSVLKKPRKLFDFFEFAKPVEVENPKQIALLLPLTGPLSEPGQAIAAGFMDAVKDADKDVDIRTYDTAKGGGLVQYRKAINEGAGIIVGPLTKTDVQAVGSSFSSTPTLLLNDYSGSLSRYKFAIGYSPKDEAEQLAHIMGKKAYHRVLLIAPQSAWGQDITTAFLKQAKKENVTVAQVIAYNDSSNLSQLIKSGLNYYEQKSTLKNGKVQVHGFRRTDIDAIFMLAYPSKARQIVPLLKYYYASDIPTYATSASYDAFYNPGKNKDLDGLYFIDIPWVFNHQLAHRAWPETWNTYSRLYALGYDSFNLTQLWSVLQSMPQSGIAKHTGILYVESNGHVRRELLLGRIQQGVAREELTML